MSQAARRALTVLLMAFLLGAAGVALLGVVIGTARAGVGLPQAAAAYKRPLTRIAHRHWGLDAPVARFAAQIHQESAWDCNAKSRFADGCAQFTPATAEWITGLYPDALGDRAAPFSPAWAFTALVLYDKRLLANIRPYDQTGTASRGINKCDRWAFTLSAYNGGLTWIERDRKLAAESGADPDRWFGHVEGFTRRAGWARRENRAYPRRILLHHEPRYRQAGYPGDLACGNG